MPLTVKNECTRLVSGIPWLDIFPDRDDVETWIKDYTPEAGIVNFYQVGLFSLLQYIIVK